MMLKPSPSLRLPELLLLAQLNLGRGLCNGAVAHSDEARAGAGTVTARRGADLRDLRRRYGAAAFSRRAAAGAAARSAVGAGGAAGGAAGITACRGCRGGGGDVHRHIYRRGRARRIGADPGL